MAADKVIFNCDEIIKACEDALARGGTLGEVFSFGSSARAGPNGTKYVDVSATVPGKKGRLVVRIRDEKHTGQIAPADDAEVARLNAMPGRDKWGQIKKRGDRQPTINIQMYSVKIETDESGAVKGEMPGDDKRSPYFRVLEYLNKYFYETITKWKKEGKIVEKDDMADTYPKDAIVATSLKFVQMYQAKVSTDSKTNPGMKLLNPIARITIKTDKETQMIKKAQIFDFKKAYKDKQTGKKKFEVLKFDGQPVNGNNIHNIASHSTIHGIVNLNAICFSNLGISIPADAQVLIIDAPVFNKVDVSDVFEDDDDDDSDLEVRDSADEGKDEAAAAAPASKAASTSGALNEDELADLVGELDA